MNALFFHTEDVICKKGDTSDSMFLIRKGLVGVYADYGTKGRTLLAVLGKGKFFGEMGVIDNAARSADVVALEDCELIEIRSDDFTSFVNENVDEVVAIMENLCERLKATNGYLEKAGRTVSRFWDANGEVKGTSAGKFKSIISYTLKVFGLNGKEKDPMPFYRPGEILFEQGDVGTYMFRILSGEAAVYTDYGTGAQKEIAVLTKGALFGEMAVIAGERRTATVVAKTDLDVTSVANGKLKSFLRSHPEDALTILRNLSAKLRSTTAKYIETLAAIAEFVGGEKGQLGQYVGGDEFITYAEYYEHGLMINPGVNDIFYNPTIFF